ncbi:single-stranded DNA-binding protein [Siminovitchia sediminis]|uniref:Single-stranded DNA-binding protein n=1 Tax=Siminovitchia sediminis TaxID=1274353 RepID=A0ABW4KKY0_9BACI
MINQVTLVGRLTKDPDLRYTVEGRAVLNITLALNRHYRNSQGEYDADFVLCTLWNKTAENTAKYCVKGSIVGVTGRIQTRHYENPEGKRVYVTEVVADAVKFMGGRPKEERQAGQAGKQAEEVREVNR